MMEEVKNTEKRSNLNIVSTLCWILGILNIFGSISIGIPAFEMSKPIIFPIVILIVGIGLCVAGYGLRKKQKYAGITAIIFSVLAFGSPPVIGLILGILIIILTIVNWKELT